MGIMEIAVNQYNQVAGISKEPFDEKYIDEQTDRMFDKNYQIEIALDFFKNKHYIGFCNPSYSVALAKEYKALLIESGYWVSDFQSQYDNLIKTERKMRERINEE